MTPHDRLLHLNDDLLQSRSATSTLRLWAKRLGLSAGGAVEACVIKESDHPPARETDWPMEPDRGGLRYRQVRLVSGGVTLAEAEIWYASACLTADMHKALKKTRRPFGDVVKSLGFRRRTVETEFLWTPSETTLAALKDSGRKEAEEDRIPFFVLRHRSLLTLPDGRAFAEVSENFTRHLLAPRLSEEASDRGVERAA